MRMKKILLQDQDHLLIRSRNQFRIKDIWGQTTSKYKLIRISLFFIKKKTNKLTNILIKIYSTWFFRNF